MALTEHDSLIFVDTAMHRGSDRTACEVTIFRSREMCYYVTLGLGYNLVMVAVHLRTLFLFVNR